MAGRGGDQGPWRLPASVATVGPTSARSVDAGEAISVRGRERDHRHFPIPPWSTSLQGWAA